MDLKLDFSMRINFVDVICDNSLRSIIVNNSKIGFAFDIRLSYYRGLFLSCVDEFDLFVDGERINHQDITFCINGKMFPIEFLRECSSEFWGLTTPARIEVLKEKGLDIGDHQIDLTLMLRIPYMPIPLGDKLIYMPLDSCGKKTLTLMEEDAK